MNRNPSQDILTWHFQPATVDFTKSNVQRYPLPLSPRCRCNAISTQDDATPTLLQPLSPCKSSFDSFMVSRLLFLYQLARESSLFSPRSPFLAVRCCVVMLLLNEAGTRLGSKRFLRHPYSSLHILHHHYLSYSLQWAFTTLATRPARLVDAALRSGAPFLAWLTRPAMYNAFPLSCLSFLSVSCTGRILHARLLPSNICVSFSVTSSPRPFAPLPLDLCLLAASSLHAVGVVLGL